MGQSTERRTEPAEHDRSLLDPESDRLPSTPLVRALRWWIPATVCLIGVVIVVAEGFTSTGVDAFFAFVGAGASIWLINFLWRLGISGDAERDSEEAARVYLAQHGHWPDEEKRDD
jgi:hypothetical protein